MTDAKKCDIILRHKKLCERICTLYNRNSKTSSCASANHLWASSQMSLASYAKRIRETQVSRADSIFSAYANVHLNTQEYRSGHNEAVLKTVCLTARGFESLFLRQNKRTPNRCPFVLLKKRLGVAHFAYKMYPS